MVPFPGIPERALAELEDPDPLALGALRAALSPLADPPDVALRILVDYGRLLLAANTIVNLTGARDWRELIENHFVDCLRAAAFVPEDARILADWGSGGGLPGLVWAAAMPEKELLLLERTGKKADFLTAAVRRLELQNAAVIRGAAEEALRRASVDLIVARAVGPLPRLLFQLRRHRLRHGVLFVMAGPRWERDWEGLPAPERASWALAARHRYALGEERGQRWVLVLKRKARRAGAV